MRHTLENTDHLTIRQAEVSEIIVEDHRITGVKTYSGQCITQRLWYWPPERT